jgi:hypothetical protein
MRLPEVPRLHAARADEGLLLHLRRRRAVTKIFNLYLFDIDRLRVLLLAQRHGAITQLADDLRLLAHSIRQVEYSGNVDNANGGYC